MSMRKKSVKSQLVDPGSDQISKSGLPLSSARMKSMGSIKDGRSAIGDTGDASAVKKAESIKEASKSEVRTDVELGEEASKSEEGKPLVNMEGLFLIRDDTEQYRYGWGRFTPDALQCLRSPAMLLVVLCFIAFANGAGIHGAFEETSERIFGISHDAMAGCMVAYYIGTVVAIVPIGYFGSHSAHKGRWLAMGSLAVAVGCLISVIPHILQGEYRSSHEGTACQANMDKQPSADCSGGKYNVYIFALGEFIIGVGSAMPYTMGIVFMDEHVSHRFSAIYTGIFRTIEIATPFIVYFIAGMLDIWRSRDLRGSWWIPLVLCALLSLLGALLMFGFPSKLAGENRALMREVMEDVVQGQRVPANAGKKWTKDVGDTAFDLLKRAVSLVGTPTYAALLIERTFTSFMTAGLGNVLVEYIGKLFSVQTELAGYATGIVIGAGVIGLMFGTFLAWLLSLKSKGNFLLIASTAFGCLICASAFVIGCDVKLAGLHRDAPYAGSEINDAWPYAACNRACNGSCSMEYQPTCWQNEQSGAIVQFYSTCFAGCQNVTRGNVGYNCTCVYENEGVKPRLCSAACYDKMIAFLIAVAWFSIFIHLRKNAVDQEILRCVPFKYRVVAFCFVAALSRLLGSIPGVFVFSQILETACYQTLGECNETCLAYDRKKLTTFSTIGFMVPNFIILISAVLVLIYLKKKSE